MIKKILIIIPVLLVLALVIKLTLVYFQQKSEFDFHTNIPNTIKLESADFITEGMIPMECSGKGKELSPELHWSNLPEGTRSLVLLMTDYDAPAPFLKIMTIDHWTVYNIPIRIIALPKGSTSTALQKDSVNLGQNFKKGIEYKGPKPPIGMHNYYFRIYALSAPHLNLNNPTKKEVMDAMKGSMLAYGELRGRF
jgi:Raf kinase inhibitor-like YbhB/YbcL family protein